MNELIGHLRIIVRNMELGYPLRAGVDADRIDRAADTILALQTQLERVERETIERCAQAAFDIQVDDYASGSAEMWNDACATIYNTLKALLAAKPNPNEAE